MFPSKFSVFIKSYLYLYNGNSHFRRPVKYIYAINVCWVVGLGKERIYDRLSSHIVVYQSFILFIDNGIPLYENTTICLCIHIFLDIWVVSHFLLLWTKLLWAFLFQYFSGHMFLVLLHKCLRVYCCQTLFQSFWTILHSHQQCISSNCFTSLLILVISTFNLSML